MASDSFNTGANHTNSFRDPSAAGADFTGTALDPASPGGQNIVIPTEVFGQLPEARVDFIGTGHDHSGGTDGNTILLTDIDGISVQTAAPGSPSGGDFWVRDTDYEVFFFDGIRGKWLSTATEEKSAARASNNVTDIYLSGPDGTPTNMTTYVLPYDATIVSISAATPGVETWTAEVRRNGVAAAIASLSIVADTDDSDDTVDVDVSAGDRIELFMSGTNVSFPRIDIRMRKRGS